VRNTCTYNTVFKEDKNRVPLVKEKNNKQDKREIEYEVSTDVKEKAICTTNTWADLASIPAKWKEKSRTESIDIKNYTALQ